MYHFPETLHSWLVELLIVFSTKVNLLLLLYSMLLRFCFLHLIKAKLFAKNFTNNSNLDDSGISLHVFPSRTNLEMRNISVTSKLVKKVITNLDLSKAFDPDCIPVVVLKKVKPELWYILVEIFNMYPVLQIRTNLWLLTTHIYHVMIIVAGGFSKKFYFLKKFHIVLFASLVVQKRKPKALIRPPVHHFVMKFNKSLNMNNLFFCIITSENNNKQYLVSYFYKQVAFWRVFL